MLITLVDDRRITLVSLQQSLTYRGLLAGIPFREDNQHFVGKFMDRAQKQCLAGAAPCLIPPVAKPVPLPPAAPADPRAEALAAQWQARHYETLPEVGCIGSFDSGELKRPGSEPYSSLVVVWFQDRFALPIDPLVLAQIERLDWESLATDWIW